MPTFKPEVVLFANEALYHGFRSRSVEAIDELWARNTPTVCIHPGWPAITSREDIIESWRSILENESQSVEINCLKPELFIQGSTACVICYERIGDGWLVATNNFVMEDGEVRLVHHQASPCVNPPVTDEDLETPEIQ